MADILQTVLQLVGGQQYVRNLNQATQAHQQLAKAQQVQARAQAQVQTAMAAGRTATARQIALAGGSGLPATVPGSGGLLAAGVGVAAITAVAMAIKDAENSFIDYDRAVIRTELTMKNMGNAMPTAQFRDFARELALTTGTSETDLVNLTGYLARFATDAPTTRRAMQVITDASALTGKSVEQVARALENIRRGRARFAFTELGISVKGVKDELYSTSQALDVIDRRTHGVAERMGRELPGQVDRSRAALEAEAHELGRLAAPATNWLAQRFIHARQADIWLIRGIARHLGIPQPGQQNAGPLSGSPSLGGSVGRSRSEDYLRRIELNTGPQGALGRALRAGGSYGEPGGGLSIRDLQLAMRHHR